MQNMIAAPGTAVEQSGSTGLGFLAGFFGGILGFVLVLALAEGKKTKKGAAIGLAGQFVVGMVLGVVFALTVLVARPATSASPPAVTVTATAPAR